MPLCLLVMNVSKRENHQLISRATIWATASGTAEEVLVSFFWVVEVPSLVDVDASTTFVSLSGAVDLSEDVLVLSEVTVETLGLNFSAALARSLK